MDDNFFILKEGQRLGPYNYSELTEKPLEPDDVILLPSQTQGVPAYDVPEFSAYFKSEGIYYPTKQNTSMYMLRLPAAIIDYFVVVSAITFLAVILFPKPVTEFAEEIKQSVDLNSQVYIEKHQNEMLILQFVALITVILYNAFCESTRLRGSLGKYILGLAVVDELGYSLTFWQALKRNLGKIIYEVASFALNIFAYLLYLRMIWGDRHQAMHDQFARCYVVKKG